MTAESSTTPADPREVIDLLCGAQGHADKAFSAPIASALVHQMWHHWQGFSIHGKDTAVALAHEILAHPARQGALRASGTPIHPDVREVLEYVSLGRRHVDVTPYPDALARRALGRIMEGELDV